jgi:hypothetical protein
MDFNAPIFRDVKIDLYSSEKYVKCTRNLRLHGLNICDSNASDRVWNRWRFRKIGS